MNKQESVINRLKWLIGQYEKDKLEILFFEYKEETHPITVNGVNVEFMDTGIRTETIVWKEKK